MWGLLQQGLQRKPIPSDQKSIRIPDSYTLLIILLNQKFLNGAETIFWSTDALASARTYHGKNRQVIIEGLLMQVNVQADLAIR